MNRSRRPDRKHRRKRGWSSVRRLTFEPLETRQLLAVLMVNSIDDVFDPQDGLVTLREAIIAANNDIATELGDIGSGADEIQFDPALFANGPATIELSNFGQLEITSDLTITGPGAGLLTIRAFDPTPGAFNGDGTRIFEIGGVGLPVAPVVELFGLTLTGGDVLDSGGAIRSNGVLTFNLSRITGNASGDEGGGIYNAFEGELTVIASTISDNVSVTWGGGIANHHNATILQSTISGNTSRDGGGIESAIGDLTIVNSTVSGNTALNSGGGIYLSISDLATITILHSTVTNNTADADIDGIGSGGGIYAEGLGLFRMDHSILAGNMATTHLAPDIDLLSNFVGTRQISFSLIGIDLGSGLAAGFPAPNGNRIGTLIAPINPLLTGLDDFGGPTQTHLLISGSPAIDAGDPFASPGANGVPSIDQRGSSRLQGFAIDIGAYEVEDTSGMPPDLFSPGPQTANEGATFDLSQFILFNDDGSGPYSAFVDWGDGSTPEFVAASGGIIFASHVYADDGTYNVQLELSNSFGADLDSFQITVNNVAPNLTVVGDQTITLGDSLDLFDLGSITDPGFDNQSLGSFETFSFYIDWNDGSIPETGTATIDTPGSVIQPTLASFNGSHIYAAPGTYIVTVRVADDDMSGDFLTGVEEVDFVERTFMVMVDPLPPDLTVPGSQTTDEGALFDLSQFQLFINDGFSTYSAIVDWGDGSAPENFIPDNQTIFASHAYADDGVYTIHIQLNTPFGSDSESFQVTVNNVLPNLSVVGDQIITIGDALNLTDLGTISDSGFDNLALSSFESFTYFIDWNDGSIPETGTATINTPGSAIQRTLASFDGSHNYATPGTYTVTVRVADDDMSGDFTSGVAGVDYVEQAFMVGVDGLPPDLFVPGPQVTNEGAIFDMSQFIFFTDDGFSPYSVIVNWGDGSPPENFTPDNGAIFASHVYADDGTYIVQVQLDNAFGSDSDSFQITINNVAPSLIVVGNQQITLGDPLNLINLGSISDPGFNNQDLSSFESFSYFIDWNDGSLPDTGTAFIDTPGSAIQPTLASFDGSHNYAAPGTYTVTVRVADDDMSGNFASGVAGVDYGEQTFTVMVSPLPELPSLIVTISGDVVDAFDFETSLREAVAFANIIPGAAVITFDPHLNGGTILLTQGQLVISDSVEIDASGLASSIIIDASGSDLTPSQKLGDGSRAFLVDDNDPTTILIVGLRNLMLIGGDISEDGGAILNRENLTVSDSTIRNNHGDRGGGIFSDGGALSVERTILRDNMAASWGGAMFVENSALLLTDSLLTSNMAATFGGGIDVLSSDTVVILRSTISGNQLSSPTGSGGGVYARTPDGHITITHSTISGNSGGRGGGIHAETDSGTIEIANSTISGNTAAENGGGIYFLSSGTAILAQNTITQNTSDSDNSGNGTGGGVYHTGNGELNIRNSIVAANSDNTGFAPDMDLLSDSPTTTNVSFSLVGNNLGTALVATSALFPDANGNLIGSAAAPIDPRLAPLSDNGGPTQTHALLVDSPAINSGNSSFQPPPDVDQRGDGFARVLQGRIDMGAFESNFTAPTRFVPVDRVIDPILPIVQFPGDEIVGIDPRAENTTLLILIGIPQPPTYPDLSNGSGGDVSPPSLVSAAKSAEFASAERTLQATLQRPHEVRREELIDAVFDLGEIELVGLLGIDMGDDPVLLEKKEEKVKPKENKEKEARKPVANTEEAAALPDDGQSPEADPVGSLRDTNWPPTALWLALAGTGTVWTSGTWWWIKQRKRTNRRG